MFSLCPPFVWRGYPIQLMWGGTPLQVWMRGTPSSWWGCTPSSWQGGTPSSWQGVPPSSWQGYPWGTPGQGYPWQGPRAGVPCPLAGGTPQQGILPPNRSSIACTCYAVGGMPLAFTQEDFLVFNENLKE